MPDRDEVAFWSSADESAPLEGLDHGYVVVSTTDDARVIHVQAFGTGAAARLGGYSKVARERVDLDTLAVTDGAFVLTAANGDTISGRYTGQGVATDAAGVLAFEASGPVTHGTGCFANVTGVLAFVGIADLATGEFRETVSGTLARARGLALGAVNG